MWAPPLRSHQGADEPCSCCPAVRGSSCRSWPCARRATAGATGCSLGFAGGEGKAWLRCQSLLLLGQFSQASATLESLLLFWATQERSHDFRKTAEVWAALPVPPLSGLDTDRVASCLFIQTLKSRGPSIKSDFTAAVINAEEPSWQHCLVVKQLWFHNYSPETEGSSLQGRRRTFKIEKEMPHGVREHPASNVCGHCLWGERKPHTPSLLLGSMASWVATKLEANSWFLLLVLDLPHAF